MESIWNYLRPFVDTCFRLAFFPGTYQSGGKYKPWYLDGRSGRLIWSYPVGTEEGVDCWSSGVFPFSSSTQPRMSLARSRMKNMLYTLYGRARMGCLTAVWPFLFIVEQDLATIAAEFDSWILNWRWGGTSLKVRDKSNAHEIIAIIWRQKIIVPKIDDLSCRQTMVPEMSEERMSWCSLFSKRVREEVRHPRRSATNCR